MLALFFHFSREKQIMETDFLQKEKKKLSYGLLSRTYGPEADGSIWAGVDKVID